MKNINEAFSPEESKEIYDKFPYYSFNLPESVICCLIDQEDNLYLVKQFRPNINDFTLEFPAGAIEGNEDKFSAAKREVKEETGLNCKVIFLNKCRVLMNRSTNYDYLFLAFVNDIDNSKLMKDKCLVVTKKKLLDMIHLNSFMHIVGLGIIQTINIKYNIDFFQENIFSKLNKYGS